MKTIGLFFTFILSVQTLDAATLTLRGQVPAVYKIEVIGAKARLTTNIVASTARLIPRISEIQNSRERIITITHP